MTHPGNDNDAQSAAACPDLSTSSSIATIGLQESFRDPTETCDLIAVKKAPPRSLVAGRCAGAQLSIERGMPGACNTELSSVIVQLPLGI
jgi:hypothetical protein